MAGNNELDNAVLGGSSDYLSDIAASMNKAVFAKDDEKVYFICVLADMLKDILTG